jgi:hypothetical protein
MWSVAAGFTTTSADDKGAKLMCMVNPTNPTGDYMDVEQVRLSSFSSYMWMLELLPTDFMRRNVCLS